MTPGRTGWPDTAQRAVEDFVAGGISAPVALMRLALTGLPVEAIIAALEAEGRLAPLLAVARQRRAGLRRLEAMVRSGAAHGAEPSPEAAVMANRAMFDRLVQVSPEASVAAYSLGDPALLDAATGEVVAWLRGLGLLECRPRILDLGCGIGRIAKALAPHASRVLGLDVSPGMIDAARARCQDTPGLDFALTSGHDLEGLEAAGFDLVLAVDVFPYLLQAGRALADRHVRDAGRLLRPGGSLVILNFSYRGIEEDRADLPDIAERHGFALLRNGTREFPLWDAHAFWLRRATVEASPTAP
ncbi:methyltransferase domain-containing protein [Roseomonas hellenica]|uniref:Methyltransferase domain-containing protein n=1 Tax=Plastoroseomonas hellenica TaxID=2687306 RepID=A0ABS5EZ24_9PROT|nr:class I SAM-dependent methyltransferase [Plastoroseomonas hellenica]MBR0665536.1 methyltransferase domain-containing protein [Plastoroseomonas hellenica]